MPTGNNVTKDKNGRTALHLAAAAGDFKKVQTLLEDPSQLENIDEPDNNQCTALHLASRGPFCHPELGQQLYESKDKDLIKDWEKQYVDIIALLIEKKADYTKTNTVGETPICLAVRDSRSVAVIIALRNRGADLRVRNIQQETLFHLAVSAKRNVFEIVEYLINTIPSMKSLFNAEDNYGNVSMHFLLAKSSHDNEEPEYNKIRIKLLKFLVEQGISIKVQNDFCETPIHLCINNSADASSLELMKKLLNHADTKWIINNRVLEGFTALHLAAMGANKNNSYNEKFIQLMLDAGADPNLKTYELKSLEDCLPNNLPPKNKNKLIKLFNNYKEKNQSDNQTNPVIDKELEGIFLGETQIVAFRKMLSEFNLTNINESLLSKIDYPDLYRELFSPATYENFYYSYQDVYSPLTGIMTTLDGRAKKYEIAELAGDIKIAKRAISWGANYRDHLATYIAIISKKVELLGTKATDDNSKSGKQEDLPTQNTELALLKSKLDEIKKAQRLVINHISFMEQIMKRAYDAAKGLYLLDRLSKRYSKVGSVLRIEVETKLKLTLQSLQQVQQPPSKKVVLTNFSEIHEKLAPKESEPTPAELSSLQGIFKPNKSEGANPVSSQKKSESHLDSEKETNLDTKIEFTS